MLCKLFSACRAGAGRWPNELGRSEETQEPRSVYHLVDRARQDAVRSIVHRLSRTRREGEVDVVADATDLTSPAAYKSGSTEGEIFRSIRDGAGETMPPFKTQIEGDTDLWHLVNFIRSLWPDSMRPPLEDSKRNEE